MPWTVGAKTKKGWPIKKKTQKGAKVVGYSDTKAKAEKAVKARYANQPNENKSK